MMHLQALRSLTEKLTSRVTKYLAIRKNLFRLADPNVIIKVDTTPKKPDSKKVLCLNSFLVELCCSFTQSYFYIKNN